MKPFKLTTLIFHSIIIIFCLVRVHAAYSQNLSFDSLQTGKKYKIVLFDDREIIGTLNNFDSVYINISDKDGLYRIRKEDVFFISRLLFPNKYNMMISLSGGLSFLTGDFNEYSYYGGQKSMTGFNAGLNMDFPITDNKTIGFETIYNRFKQDGYSTFETAYEPTTMSFYSFKINFKLGNFEPKSKFFYYAVFGIGMNLTKYSESSYTYYSSYDSTYQTSFSPGYSRTNAILGLGGGAGYKFSRHFGVFAEMQYNFITSTPFLFWGSGYFPFRLGLVYMIY